MRRTCLLAAFVLLAPVAAHAASFDCAKARAADEKAICHHRALEDADVRMATMFELEGHLLAMGGRGALQDAQIAWLKQRRRCGAEDRRAHAEEVRRDERGHDDPGEQVPPVVAAPHDEVADVVPNVVLDASEVVVLHGVAFEVSNGGADDLRVGTSRRGGQLAQAGGTPVVVDLRHGVIGGTGWKGPHRREGSAGRAPKMGTAVQPSSAHARYRPARRAARRYSRRWSR